MCFQVTFALNNNSLDQPNACTMYVHYYHGHPEVKNVYRLSNCLLDLSVGLNNQQNLVFTFLMIGWKQVNGTQWLGLLDKGSIVTALILLASKTLIFPSFTSKENCTGF